MKFTRFRKFQNPCNIMSRWLSRSYRLHLGDCSENFGLDLGPSLGRFGENNRILFNTMGPSLSVYSRTYSQRVSRNARLYLDKGSEGTPEHCWGMFRLLIWQINPTIISEKVFSFTPFLLPFFHYTSQSFCLQCFCSMVVLPGPNAYPFRRHGLIDRGPS